MFDQGTDPNANWTYNSVDMTPVTDSPFIPTTAGEPAVVVFEFDGNVTGGSQTVQCTHDGNPFKVFACMTLVADADIVEQDTSVLDVSSQDDPSAPDLDHGGVDCFVAMGFGSGRGNVDQITPRLGWTDEIEFDAAANQLAVYRYNTIGSTDVTPGYDTDIADDAVILAAAFAEEASNNELAASLSTVATVAAALNAVGDIDAALATALTVTADTDATGSLTATANLVATVAGALNATGDLSTSALLACTVAAELKALGELAAAASLVATVAADLNDPNANQLEAALSTVLTTTPGLNATGSLAVSAALAATVAANLTAADSPDIAANLQAALTVTPALSGLGQLAAALDTVLTTTPNIFGAGELGAAMAIEATAAASLNATGGLSVVLQTALTISADSSAPGELQAAAQTVLSIAANLIDAGAVVSVRAVRLVAEASNRYLLAGQRTRHVTGTAPRRRLNPKRLN